jgi:hypothetical protein
MKPHPSAETDPLANRARRLASRHQTIPPTPRDTLAVLMQEAERVRDQRRTATTWWLTGKIAIPLAAAALLIAAVTIFRPPADPAHPLTDQTTPATATPDLGLDTTVWDMEVASLLDALDDTLLSVAAEDTPPDALMETLLNPEESWL